MLHPVTKEEYYRRAFLDGPDAYYDPKFTRWEDHAEWVVGRLKHMPFEAQDVLELGAYKTPLVPGCTVMDLAKYAQADCTLVVHDGTRFPWPFTNRQFRVVIACHFLEHLGAAVASAWREMERVAEYAVICVPFRWTDPTDKLHLGVTLRTISAWTGGMTPWEAHVYSKPNGTYRNWNGMFHFEGDHLRRY
jgi:hypothetical protein